MPPLRPVFPELNLRILNSYSLGSQVDPSLSSSGERTSPLLSPRGYRTEPSHTVTSGRPETGSSESRQGMPIRPRVAQSAACRGKPYGSPQRQSSKPLAKSQARAPTTARRRTGAPRSRGQSRQGGASNNERALLAPISTAEAEAIRKRRKRERYRENRLRRMEEEEMATALAQDRAARESAARDRESAAREPELAPTPPSESAPAAMLSAAQNQFEPAPEMATADQPVMAVCELKPEPDPVPKVFISSAHVTLNWAGDMNMEVDEGPPSLEDIPPEELSGDLVQPIEVRPSQTTGSPLRPPPGLPVATITSPESDLIAEMPPLSTLVPQPQLGPSHPATEATSAPSLVATNTPPHVALTSEFQAPRVLAPPPGFPLDLPGITAAI